jgi:ubiquitin-protein ligase
MRRLLADYEAVRELCRQSSILDMSCSGEPASTYLFRFQGRGLAQDTDGNLQEQWLHEVRVHLGANYPRVIPELHWLTPIFHPNISANGLVCLGGYSTHWVPSLRMDDLCLMLWDMIRYRNFDIASPYNRIAAEWAKTQRHYILPLDPRPLRERPESSSPAAEDAAVRTSADSPGGSQPAGSAVTGSAVTGSWRDSEERHSEITFL